MNLERNFIERSPCSVYPGDPNQNISQIHSQDHNQDLDIDAEEIQNMSITKMIYISPFYSHNNFPQFLSTFYCPPPCP